jgi:hypothetical protein
VFISLFIQKETSHATPSYEVPPFPAQQISDQDVQVEIPNEAVEIY